MLTLVNLEEKIERINSNYGFNFMIEKGETDYLLVEEDAPIIEGDFETISNYLNGVVYGYLRNKPISPVVKYFKDKVGEGVIIATVNKVAKDTYFSQETRVYRIKILDVTENVVTYQARGYNICSNGIKIANTDIDSSVLTTEIEDNVSLKDVEEKILNKMISEIDEDTKKILLKKKTNNTITHINSDMILSISKEELKKFGWSNDGLITVRYSVEYSL